MRHSDTLCVSSPLTSYLQNKKTKHVAWGKLGIATRDKVCSSRSAYKSMGRVVLRVTQDTAESECLKVNRRLRYAAQRYALRIESAHQLPHKIKKPSTWLGGSWVLLHGIRFAVAVPLINLWEELCSVLRKIPRKVSASRLIGGCGMRHSDTLCVSSSLTSYLIK